MSKKSGLVLIGAAVLVTGTILSAVVSYSIYTSEVEARGERTRANVQEIKQRFTQFEYRARLYHEAVQSSFKQKLEALSGLREYIAGSAPVSWEGFESYVSPILQRYSDIRGIFWIPTVERGALGRFEQIAENSGPPDYELRFTPEEMPEWTAQWSPVYYLAPLEGNESWLGVNAATHPVFAGVFEAHSGDAGPWRSIAFSAEGESRPEDFFFALNLAGLWEGLRRDGDSTQLYESGFVAALINIPRLVAAAVDSLDVEPIEILLYDAEGRRVAAYGDLTDEELEASRDANQLEEITTGATYLDRELEVFEDGRNWRMIFMPSQPIDLGTTVPSAEVGNAWIVGIVGMVLSIVAAAAVYLLIGELMRRRSAEERQRHLAQNDELTGLLNRRALSACLELEWKRRREDGRKLSVIMIDLDHFKPINDTHGHAMGDTVLTRMGELLREASRENDIAARYGGEEFCVVLPNTAAAEAHTVAERIRFQLAAQSFQTDGAESIRMTCSAGVASAIASDESAESLLRRADDALYAAKEEGRDRVVEASS